jgi:arylsulfatase
MRILAGVTRAAGPWRDMRILAVVAIAGLVAGGCSLESDTRPNLLLITVDSLRADRLGCYGGKPGVGARICALQDDGIRYVWAFATAPSSAPAVASILTARYPSGHGVHGDPATFLRSSYATLAEELRAAGYLTAAVVSSPELNRSRNLQQGFAHFDDGMSKTRGDGQFTRDANETTDAAIAWARSNSGPWFLWVHYRDLHGPLRAGESLLAAIRSIAPAGTLDGALDRELPILADESGSGGIPRSLAVEGLSRRSQYETLYDAVLRRIDGEIHRLLEELQTADAPLAVLLAGDHGVAFGEDNHYLAHGHSVGLEQIRIPLLWRPPLRPTAGEAGVEPSPRPSLPRGQRVLEPVSTLDAAPTLLAAAGLEAPESFRGSPLPRNESQALADRVHSLFAEHPRQIALISGRHYYARDRRAPVFVATEEEEAGEPLLEATLLVGAEARVAELWAHPGGDERDLEIRRGIRSEQLPAYEPARPTGIAPHLEPLVADFLATTKATSPAQSPPSE